MRLLLKLSNVLEADYSYTRIGDIRHSYPTPTYDHTVFLFLEAKRETFSPVARKTGIPSGNNRERSSPDWIDQRIEDEDEY